jgi:hypothetical protein
MSTNDMQEVTVSTPRWFPEAWGRSRKTGMLTALKEIPMGGNSGGMVFRYFPEKERRTRTPRTNRIPRTVRIVRY